MSRDSAAARVLDIARRGNIRRLGIQSTRPSNIPAQRARTRHSGGLRGERGRARHNAGRYADHLGRLGLRGARPRYELADLTRTGDSGALRLWGARTGDRASDRALTSHIRALSLRCACTGRYTFTETRHSGRLGGSCTRACPRDDALAGNVRELAVYVRRCAEILNPSLALTRGARILRLQGARAGDEEPTWELILCGQQKPRRIAAVLVAEAKRHLDLRRDSEGRPDVRVRRVVDDQLAELRIVQC